MNNRDVNNIGQKERELEELLCLAYLFTHSNSDLDLDESEDVLLDDVEIFTGLFVN